MCDPVLQPSLVLSGVCARLWAAPSTPMKCEVASSPPRVPAQDCSPAAKGQRMPGRASTAGWEEGRAAGKAACPRHTAQGTQDKARAPPTPSVTVQGGPTRVQMNLQAPVGLHDLRRAAGLSKGRSPQSMTSCGPTTWCSLTPQPMGCAHSPCAENAQGSRTQFSGLRCAL